MSDNTFREFRFHGVGGLQLYARVYGPEPQTAIPVICLPGLTRNGRDFHELAGFLASSPGGGFPVISLDYRGRGNSERDKDKSRYTIAVETSDVIAACAYFGIEKAIFIGTSRGGLILHHLIGLKPDLIAASILNDIGPVIEIEGLLAIRDYLSARPAPGNWPDAAEGLQTIHGPEFPVLSASDWASMARALYRDDAGMPVADFDPALVVPLQGLTADTALPALWPQFDAFAGKPMMVIRGEHSKLLSEATVWEMARRHPGLTALTAPGQGHAPILHLGDLETHIAAFLEHCSRTS